MKCIRWKWSIKKGNELVGVSENSRIKAVENKTEVSESGFRIEISRIEVATSI